MTTLNHSLHNIVILGCTGMLGSIFERIAHEYNHYQFYLVCRDISRLAPSRLKNVPSNCSYYQFDNIESRTCLNQLIESTSPGSSTFVNCIGVTKQKITEISAESVIYINSVFPKILSHALHERGSRLVHISTDCVFDGQRGFYEQSECPNSNDIYGVSKYLGEAIDPTHVTLRTSIIGHERISTYSLLDWFLSHEDNQTVQGFKNAWFSGFTTLELARIILNIVLTRSDLCGLHHVSAERINKYDLLSLTNEIYGRHIKIEPNLKFKIDRSLDSTPFRTITGYEPPQWSTMMAQIRNLYFPS